MENSKFTLNYLSGKFVGLAICGIFLLIGCEAEETPIVDKELKMQKPSIKILEKKSKNSNEKINICHYSSEEDKYLLIEISEKAFPAHQGHRDIRLDDHDGDGYVPDNECGFGEMGDCDDNDPSINPGIEEICDGIDNDCDGKIDEDIQSSYYADSDGDGYGDPSNTVDACAKPDGYVSDNTDCDDTNPLVNPGSTEICGNGIDDNCDGNMDEGLKLIFYADSDGDGFGDANASLEDCSQPTGYVVDNTDCNDADANVNPGATEVCGNSVDENCDGVIEGGQQANIGDYREGGIVFKVDATGCHGLVISFTGRGMAPWGCSGTYIGTTFSRSGKESTQAIVQNCSQPGIAARLASDYTTTVNSVVYDDWFLPSYYEYIDLYANIGIVNAALGSAGGIIVPTDGGYIWTSNEDDAEKADAIYPDPEDPKGFFDDYVPKTGSYRVIFIREF